MTQALTERVRAYWNTHIHDLDISTNAPGTPGFFADLDQYHFEKLHHLVRLVPEGKAIPFDAGAAPEERARAVARWRALIPEGRLPASLTPAKKEAP